MLERTDHAALPPYAHLVRREGHAVAAYRHAEGALVHAAPLEDATVTPDRCTGLDVPPHHRLWRVDAAVREQDRAEVDRLAGEWLAGCNR